MAAGVISHAVSSELRTTSLLILHLYVFRTARQIVVEKTAESYLSDVSFLMHRQMVLQSSFAQVRIRFEDLKARQH